MRYSSTSGGAGTMAEKVMAGSVPMATATSILPLGRSPSGKTEPPEDARHESTAACRAAGTGGGEAPVPHSQRSHAFAVMFGRDLLPLPVHAGGHANRKPACDTCRRCVCRFWDRA